MKNRILKPPQKLNLKSGEVTAFLAGSIEMGKATDWQTKITPDLLDAGITVLNPRRDDWDSSWVQSIKNPQFREQVEWEIQGQEIADVILMYFDPDTKAPITLLELGLFASSGKMVICCPRGYWRKGNVDVVCNYYQVETATNLKELVKKGLSKVFKK